MGLGILAPQPAPRHRPPGLLQAGLPEGQSITLHTANGQRPGQLVRSVPVRAGHLVMNDTSVTVGLTGMPPEQALLGQAFLKHFDVEIRRDEMVLRQRR